MQETIQQPEGGAAVRSSDLLGRIGDDLQQERKILNGLAWLCDQGEEGRVGHEIMNASRALTEAIELIKLYRSGVNALAIL
jgi:hypothetical protein